jgi:DNA-binding beta-propeller fold protein YncE
MKKKIIATLSVLAAGLVLSQAPLGREVQAQGAAASVPTFEVDAAWPKLPNNWVIGDPSSIAVDKHDNVWILHRPRTIPADKKDHAAPPVLEFDASGKFVQAWGGPGDGFDWPDTEHGIYVDSKDVVWIGGNNPVAQLRLTQRSDDMLLKFTTKGKLIKQFGGRDKSGGNKDTVNPKEPADIVVNPKTNEAYIADGYGNRRVWVIDADTGAFKRMWGAFANAPLDPPPPPPAPPAGATPPAGAAAPPRVVDGDGPPQFGIVHAIRLSNDGLVYVADRGNSRVQVFTEAGKYVNQVFINRTAPSPTTAAGLALSPDPQQRFLYVSDFGNGHIVVVERKTLKVLTQFGERGKEPGNFQNAHHMAADSKGNLYTAEVNPGSRVQKMVFKGMKPAGTQ